MPLKGTTFHFRKPAPPITRAPAPWTPEEVARLQRLWKKGQSIGKIGRSMQRSTGSIAGKLDRLGLFSDDTERNPRPRAMPVEDAARELGVLPDALFDDAESY